MDLQQATLTMALLMKKEIDLNRQFIEGNENRQDSSFGEIKRQYEYIKANTREFGNRLAANPPFFDIMESWRVNVGGKEGVSEETMKMAKEDSDMDTLVEKAGNMAASVKEFLLSQNLPVAGISAGEDGWDIGLLCTEKVSKELCRSLHQRFAYAIKLGLITVSRRFSGHNLPGLYNWTDAERILKAHGPDLHL